MTFHPRRAALFGLATVVPIQVGVCAPICEGLARTKDPFELRITSQGGSSYLSRVYRGEELFRTEVKEVTGHPSKALFQGNFVLATPMPDGSTLASLYDVPTNEYIWNQTARQVHVSSSIRGGHAGTAEQTYRILGDEAVEVGDCVFSSKHFVVTTKSKSIEIVAEVWFAPSLNVALKSHMAITSVTGKTDNWATATAIRALPPGSKEP